VTAFGKIYDPIDTDKEGNSLTYQDIMSDNDNIFDHIDLRLKAEQMYGFIEKALSEREKKIIVLRYGLFCQKPLTQREVAKQLGISRSYVSRHAYCKRSIKIYIFNWSSIFLQMPTDKPLIFWPLKHFMLKVFTSAMWFW